jgi:hypothetical protein
LRSQDFDSKKRILGLCRGKFSPKSKKERNQSISLIHKQPKQQRFATVQFQQLKFALEGMNQEHSCSKTIDFENFQIILKKCLLKYEP